MTKRRPIFKRARLIVCTGGRGCMCVCFRRVPLRQAHPGMVYKIESSGAIVDMDMSTSLLFDALSAMGCDYHPLLVVEDSGIDRREW